MYYKRNNRANYIWYCYAYSYLWVGGKIMWVLEFVGMAFAMAGFSGLSFGYLKIGFVLGLFSCCLLIPFFYDNELYFMLTLQAFFAIMNSIGIYRNLSK